MTLQILRCKNIDSFLLLPTEDDLLEKPRISNFLSNLEAFMDKCSEEYPELSKEELRRYATGHINRDHLNEIPKNILKRRAEESHHLSGCRMVLKRAKIKDPFKKETLSAASQEWEDVKANPELLKELTAEAKKEEEKKRREKKLTSREMYKKCTQNMMQIADFMKSNFRSHVLLSIFTETSSYNDFPQMTWWNTRQ